MDKNLPVKYKSQYDDDAKLSSNDCGSCSVAMIINHLGGEVTTDQVQEKTGAGQDLVTVEQLQKAVTELGYVSEFYTNQDFESLKKFLNKDITPIVLVHYGSLTSTQDKDFIGGHFMPIVGYREDNGIYANDPDFQGELRSQGDHHNYTNEEFMKAWGDAALDSNPPFSFIVIMKVEETPEKVEKVKVVTEKGLNARSEPKLGNNIVNVFPKGIEIEIVAKLDGEEVGGVKTWMRVKGEQEVYIWGGGVEPIKVVPIKIEKPKEKPVDKDKLIRDLQKENKRLLDAIKQLNKITGAFIQIEETPEDKKDEVSTSLFSNLLELLRIK